MFVVTQQDILYQETKPSNEPSGCCHHTSRARSEPGHQNSSKLVRLTTGPVVQSTFLFPFRPLNFGRTFTGQKSQIRQPGTSSLTLQTKNKTKTKHAVVLTCRRARAERRAIGGQFGQASEQQQQHHQQHHLYSIDWPLPDSEASWLEQQGRDYNISSA